MPVRGWLRRLRPDTLFASIAGMVMINLLLVQGVTYTLFRLEADHLPGDERALPEQVAMAWRVMNAVPAADRKQIAHAISNRHVRVEVVDTPIGFDDLNNRDPAMAWTGPLRDHLADRLGSGFVDQMAITRDLSVPDDAAPDADAPPATLAMNLSDGQVVEFHVRHFFRPFRWSRLLTVVGTVCLVIGFVSLWFTRRLSSSFAGFAEAADSLGRTAEAAPLRVAGPREVRMATLAFNRMQERLRRFVHDRTQMLAAISHDLRTPLTRMRLRAEFVEDDEQRDKMLRDLSEMDQMITATLNFARDDVTREPRRAEDLNELVGELCAIMSETGQDTQYEAAQPILIECSPVALRRALGNLLENAVKYGQRARARLASTSDHVMIEIDDDGPGIPAEAQDKVFQPFFRLEGSRNRDTGGVGLGLSVARTIVRGHGGDIQLANRPGGGLRVTVMLPA